MSLLLRNINMMLHNLQVNHAFHSESLGVKINIVIGAITVIDNNVVSIHI